MLPKWNDPALNAGTKIRTALWLISEVGVGNSFTKEQHRAAFPGIAQADRRLRDLRTDGWVIHTSSEDVSLNSEEQRFVSIGAAVWNRGAQKKADNVLTAKMRREAFAESDHQCRVCGIAGGEKYPDAPHMSAVLSVSRRAVTFPDGQVKTAFISECKLCRSGSRVETHDLSSLLDEFEDLSASDQSLFLQWANQGRRSRLDRVWMGYRRLPEDVQKEVRKKLSIKI
jgi:hypothetical protein